MKKLIRIMTSSWFFWVVLAFLVFEALWIALSFNYPMLWDEYYHVGLIKYYSHQLSPFIAHQPPSLDVYGNVERSPKYLYHYLMSFPFRAFVAITPNEAVQIILLRITNIAMFAGGLVAFRYTFRRVFRTDLYGNITLFVLALLPLSSLFAAHVNYDNMQFLLLALTFYWAVRYIQSRYTDSKWLLLIAAISAFNAEVKFTSLAVSVPLFAFLLFRLIRTRKKRAWQVSYKSFLQMSRIGRVGLSLLLLVGVGLGVERFGINLVKYHAIEPDCAKVVSLERCLKFSPYEQEYRLRGENDAPQTPLTIVPHIAAFTFGEWIEQIYVQFFTTGTQVGIGNFEVPSPLFIPMITMIVIGLIALVCVLLRRRQILGNDFGWMFLSAIIGLTFALYFVDLGKYLDTGHPLAIQGRYLAPIAPIVLAGGAWAIHRTIHSHAVKSTLLALMTIGLIWGGGLLTHIALSKDDWFWRNQTIISANESIRETIRPWLL